MTCCPACGCPTASSRLACPWCANAVDEPGPVVFAEHHEPDRIEWTVDGRLVASAAVVQGCWQIRDRQGRAVVSLVPVDGKAGELSLVGPESRHLGSIAIDRETTRDAVLFDSTGRTHLVRRADTLSAAHIVDRRGEIIAVASHGDHGTVSDILVTALGSGQPLSLLFGLLLATDADRQPGDRLA